jgi:hypothetical protein
LIAVDHSGDPDPHFEALHAHLALPDATNGEP